MTSRTGTCGTATSDETFIRQSCFIGALFVGADLPPPTVCWSLGLAACVAQHLCGIRFYDEKYCGLFCPTALSIIEDLILRGGERSDDTGDLAACQRRVGAHGAASLVKHRGQDHQPTLCESYYSCLICLATYMASGNKLFKLKPAARRGKHGLGQPLSCMSGRNRCDGLGKMAGAVPPILFLPPPSLLFLPALPSKIRPSFFSFLLHFTICCVEHSRVAA